MDCLVFSVPFGRNTLAELLSSLAYYRTYETEMCEFGVLELAVVLEMTLLLSSDPLLVADLLERRVGELFPQFCLPQ